MPRFVAYTVSACQGKREDLRCHIAAWLASERATKQRWQPLLQKQWYSTTNKRMPHTAGGTLAALNSYDSLPYTRVGTLKLNRSCKIHAYWREIRFYAHNPFAACARQGSLDFAARGSFGRDDTGVQCTSVLNCKKQRRELEPACKRRRLERYCALVGEAKSMWEARTTQRDIPIHPPTERKHRTTND